MRADGRPTAVRPAPAHALTEDERQAVLETTLQPDYAALPPGQIVPRLADEGVYLASESTFYRVLRDHNLQHHRGRAKAPSTPRPPTTHRADQPNQAWCWDITWLPGLIRGQFTFLYLIIELYSRKIVGWEVHEVENNAHARDLVERACPARSRRVAILRGCHELYDAVRRRHPTRWSSDTRNWGHIREVWLHPENDRALMTKVA